MDLKRSYSSQSSQGDDDGYTQDDMIEDAEEDAYESRKRARGEDDFGDDEDAPVIDVTIDNSIDVTAIATRIHWQRPALKQYDVDKDSICNTHVIYCNACITSHR